MEEKKSFKKNKLLISLLVISLLFNLAVVLIDIIPFVRLRLEQKYFKNETSIVNTKFPEQVILNKSLEMASSSKVTMIWNEQASFSEELLKLRNTEQESLFKQYNYPRAFLISGLTDYAKSQNDTILMLKIGKIFDRYINSDGVPAFTFDKVDQIPFGVAAINLFQFTNDIRYKKFADYIYAKAVSLTDKEGGIILYRKDHKVQLNDVLGMICPFLIRYEEINKESKSTILAQKQLQYYIQYGVDKDTYLPTHGINLKTKIKIGPTNWGRGIGWYIIALSEYVKHKETYSFELNRLINTLKMLRTNENVWTQFPGLSEHFDGSSTTMFMYAINLTHPGTYSKEDILKILGKYITNSGIIRSTSGDTYGINDYSRTFGDSELSQGMLLMLLSTTNNK